MTELNPDIIFEMACSGDLSKIQEMLDDLDGDRLRPNDHIYLEYGLVAGRQGMGADSGVGGAAIAIRICPRRGYWWLRPFMGYKNENL